MSKKNKNLPEENLDKVSGGVGGLRRPNDKLLAELCKRAQKEAIATNSGDNPAKMLNPLIQIED